MLGYAEAELVGLKVVDLFHPAEVGRNMRLIRQIVDGELPHYQGELRLVTKGNGIIWARVTGTLIRDENKRAVYGLVMVEDVTERKRMEQYVLRVERLAAMGRMTAVLAHEIKNPLQAIKGNLELVLNYLDDPAEREAYLRLCLQDLNLLAEMTGQIFKMAAPVNEEFEVVSIANLVRQTLALVNPSIQQAGIYLITRIPDDLRPVRIVPDRISQVMLSILDNAIEVTPRSGHIEVSARATIDSIRLDFTNSGPSIHPEHLEYIFDPFFTTKPRATGLGLSISHNIVEQHGGTLSVKNGSDEQGVTFTVTLPFNNARVPAGMG